MTRPLKATMTLGQFHTLVDGEPDDVRMTALVDGVWAPITALSINDVEYSAGPNQPARFETREITLLVAVR